MYCGDGINDLAALAAADVGMAVGSSDASAAAAVVTKQNGIAGLTFLRLLCPALPHGTASTGLCCMCLQAHFLLSGQLCSAQT